MVRIHHLIVLTVACAALSQPVARAQGVEPTQLSEALSVLPEVSRFELDRENHVTVLQGTLTPFGPSEEEDVARAFVKALADDATIGQTYQLCGPKVYSLRELVTYVREQIGVRRPIVGLPDPIAKLQARIFGLLPGKPFSLDNYQSLTVHSICDKDGLSALGIEATPLESVAPTYLRGLDVTRDLDQLRKNASR